MSEPQSNIEIEDVLSSIRRLVSQDHRRPKAAEAPAPTHAAPTHTGPSHTGPSHAPAHEAVAPEAEGAALAAEEAPAFVLSEALRVDEPVDEPLAQEVDEAAERAWAAEEAALPEESAPDLSFAQGDAAVSDEIDADHTVDLASPDAAFATPAEEAGWSAPTAETATPSDAQWEQPVGDIFGDGEVLPEAPVAPFEAFAVDDGIAVPRRAQDLGEELSRLEGSIAEMEAAFAEPTPAFEPELGDPFGAAALPETFEAAEWVDAEEAAFVEAEDYIVEASEVPEADYHEELSGDMHTAPVGAASVGSEAGAATVETATVDPATVEAPPVEAATVEAATVEAVASAAEDAALLGGEEADADLGDEAWAAEAGAMGFTPEDEAERTREAAQGIHRLHLADAEHWAPPHEPRRSTYQDIRAEAALEPEDLLAREVVAPSLEGLDEEALRDIVRDIIRQELQGVLGERITRNVRKLVRREIQRALASDEFE